MFFQLANSVEPNQGPVVQSIVSLTMSLRCQLVKYMPTKLSKCCYFWLKMLLFFVEKKCKIPFAMHKITLFQQKITAYL